MSEVFFFYTIGLLLLCISTAAISITAYASTRRSVFLYSCGLFAVYSVEMCSIFFSEYMGQNVAFSLDTFYNIDSALIRILSSACVLQFMWLILLDTIDEQRANFKILPIFYYVLACIFVLIALPYGPVKQFIYYTLRQVFALGCLGYTYYTYKKSDSNELHIRLEHYKKFFKLAIGLLIGITIEDAIMILIFNPTVTGAYMPLYISNRNFVENIVIIISAIYACTYAYRVLAIRIKATPDKEEDVLERHAADILPFYREHYGLSARETEILSHLVLSQTNQEIAEELFLALGTVKTHVHNILTKTGMKNREELIEDFWRS